MDDGGLSHDDGSQVADWALRRYRLRHAGGSTVRANYKPSPSVDTVTAVVQIQEKY